MTNAEARLYRDIEAIRRNTDRIASALERIADNQNPKPSPPEAPVPNQKIEERIVAILRAQGPTPWARIHPALRAPRRVSWKVAEQMIMNHQIIWTENNEKLRLP